MADRRRGRLSLPVTGPRMEISSLEGLRALRQRRVRRHLSRVSLKLPLAAGLNQQSEMTLNASLRACGCELGALFALAGVVASLSLFGSAPAVGLSATLVRAMILVIALAAAGKGIGLALAERRLRRTIDRLERLLVTPPAH
jgi:hypothetical protein